MKFLQACLLDSDYIQHCFSFYCLWLNTLESLNFVEAYMAALVNDEGNPHLHYGFAYILDTKLKKQDLALKHYIRFSEIVSVLR